MMNLTSFLLLIGWFCINLYQNIDKGTSCLSMETSCLNSRCELAKGRAGLVKDNLATEQVDLLP